MWASLSPTAMSTPSCYLQTSSASSFWNDHPSSRQKCRIFCWWWITKTTKPSSSLFPFPTPQKSGVVRPKAPSIFDPIRTLFTSSTSPSITPPSTQGSLFARDRYSCKPLQTPSHRQTVHFPFFEAWFNAASLINPTSPTTEMDLGSELVSPLGWTNNTPRRTRAGNANISSRRFSGWLSPGKFFASFGVVWFARHLEFFFRTICPHTLLNFSLTILKTTQASFLCFVLPLPSPRQARCINNNLFLSRHTHIAYNTIIVFLTRLSLDL